MINRYKERKDTYRRKRFMLLGSQEGFSVLEVMLAAAIFVIFSIGSVGLVLQGFVANRLGSEETIANQYASEGIEAVRSIKNQNFNSFVNTLGTGITRSASNVWSFSGTNNRFGKYTRAIAISDVQRDGSGNIVSSGGNVDPNIKKIVSTVSWNVSPTRNNSVVLTEYMSNWKSGRGGMLVYRDGSGGVADGVKYRLFDANTDTWTASTSAFDVDGSTTNKVLRTVKVYTSSTRNEKIAISRHYDGTSQYIYATVWNGIAWGTPTLLSNWTAGTFLDVQNFDGTYLNNGTFMTVYSDNTVIPKYRIWNGTTWNTQGSLTTLGASNVPNYIVADARPGTNEVMAALFTQGASVTTADTLTEYWSGSAWSAIVSHSAVSITNTMRYVDFQWSSNLTTTGALIYADSSTAKTLAVKLFVADGLGGGSWGAAVHGAAQTNNLESLDLQPKPGSNEFQACDKDAATTSTIVCRKITFSGSVPTINTPTNPILVTGTDAGIQRSFDFGFESVTGDPAIMVYSDTTAVPKFKKYTASTAKWDAAASSITTTGGAPGVIKSVRVIPQDQGDDMIAFMADANVDVFSIFWSGSGNAMYITPVSRAFTGHGNNGSATTDFWYDFAWDKF